MFQNVNVSTRWFWTVRTNVSRSSYYYISNRLDDQVVEGALTPICMNGSLSDSGSLERPFFLFAIWTSCMHKCIYIGYLYSLPLPFVQYFCIECTQLLWHFFLNHRIDFYVNSDYSKLEQNRDF